MLRLRWVCERLGIHYVTLGEYVKRAGLSQLSQLVEDLTAMASSFAGKLYGVSHKYEKVVEDARKLIEDPLSNSKCTLSQKTTPELEAS